MNNRIEEYIRETPARLQDIRRGAESLFAPVKGEHFDRIIVAGSGTSYHSAAQMENAMRRASGLDVHAVYPFAVTREMLGDGSRTLFVGVSQGGGSLSTLKALKIAQNAGCTLATMCGTQNAVIDTLADHVLTVAVGEEEAGAKTKGYYGTKLNLLLLAQAIGRARGALDEAALADAAKRLQETIDRFDGVTEAAEAWVRKNSARLATTKDLRFVGPASLYGDTLEVALKTLETLRVPVSAYEFNEFIHGIYNAITEDSFVILLDDGTEPRMQTMAAVLREWTEDVVVIGTGEAAHTDLHLGDIPRDEFETFLFPIAGQMISALVPWAKGYDPTAPKDPTFHDRLASKER
ncbi:SIS domain-containing protein [Brachybacterium sacelli]|uniref:Glucosamine 6-phosphate synthetase-like amidotransferase/phosphosugar isomerase protein n=1 Tax=Brachybacterium sacelli TaxID=173364 RepID=A0ABS4WZ34_9MICO|nr:glucosamine 6-phosphate synthetase-like amidotransferase/phosphosugar isomerase protein [Brachybacterium sacelli]